MHLTCRCQRASAGGGWGARCKPGLAAAGMLLGKLSWVIRHQFGDVLMLGRVQPGLPEGLGLALASQRMLAWLGGGGRYLKGNCKSAEPDFVLDFAMMLCRGFGVENGGFSVLGRREKAAAALTRC